MPIDPSFAISGPEWQIGGTSLTETQNEAAGAAQALATGQASDPTAVVMAVERAQLAMQLASQIRTKAVEAAQDIFHTQV
jgi:flagellar hook-basal body complex protein FliE